MKHKKPITRDRVESWLIKNRHLIKVPALAEELNIEKEAIYQCFNVGKRLDDTQIQLLHKVIKRMSQ
ncbi:hypothetical protein HN014_10860 [Aquimarina sp. TRL1]|uniref:hypothetical protein n=1 Tax=Aquimarina sp. (strain TRL1) TaxID=2736252 RepID=UPI00158965F2|nr:hypothetical protein [Aquimarina sp. TRL1]QKX04155.1 hypothetical protein HN014_04275 [Aquimarina sp. TRL1]QKX05393.1 hypothetical protein HN014_10860 [Aquimarina sp. TRL1]